MAQKKIAVVIEGGLVRGVYVSGNPAEFDVEIIDFDTTDEDELRAADERLSVVEQNLVNAY